MRLIGVKRFNYYHKTKNIDSNKETNSEKINAPNDYALRRKTTEKVLENLNNYIRKILKDNVDFVLGKCNYYSKMCLTVQKSDMKVY